MKLRLEVAEGEVTSPPSRVRARPAPAATAWGLPDVAILAKSGPERILARFVGQVEAHVRTLAAVPASIIQRVREGR